MPKSLLASLAGVVLVSACATAPLGPQRVARPARPADPSCVARAVRVPPSVAARGVSFRMTVEFWVEANGSVEVVESASWVGDLGVEENRALANELLAAVSRCAWLPATVDGVPTRARAALPLRFSGVEQAEPAAESAPVAAGGVRPAEEADAGCIDRAVSRLAAPGPGLSVVVAVAVEGDGTWGPVRIVSRPADLDDARAQALAGWVATALEGCRLVPGTIGGRPARTIWMSEIRTGR